MGAVLVCDDVMIRKDEREKAQCSAPMSDKT